MTRRSAADEIRLPSDEEPIPAVTIFDGQGRVVRVVPADDFRRGRRNKPGESAPVHSRKPLGRRARGLVLTG